MEKEKIEVVCKMYCCNCKLWKIYETSHLCVKKDINKGDKITIEIQRGVQ